MHDARMGRPLPHQYLHPQRSSAGSMAELHGFGPLGSWRERLFKGETSRMLAWRFRGQVRSLRPGFARSRWPDKDLPIERRSLFLISEYLLYTQKRNICYKDGNESPVVKSWGEYLFLRPGHEMKTAQKHVKRMPYFRSFLNYFWSRF